MLYGAMRVGHLLPWPVKPEMPAVIYCERLEISKSFFFLLRVARRASHNA